MSKICNHQVASWTGERAECVAIGITGQESEALAGVRFHLHDGSKQIVHAKLEDDELDAEHRQRP